MFITFEGLDGAGKSTQISHLRARLLRLGVEVVLTREPGGTPLGDALRAMLLDPSQKQLSGHTEALMYAASRAELLHEVIRPALAEGKLVICDRYVDASIAYQGVGLGLGVDVIAKVNEFATGGLRPDLTILLDLRVEESRHRVSAGNRTAGPDRIEQRDSAYFSRVRDAFLQIAKNEPDRVKVLDGERSPSDLEQEIWYLVSNRMNRMTGNRERYGGGEQL